MIIVYGGAFNPPTNAHYEIAEMIIKKFKPDRFIFLPVGNKYEKSSLIPFNYRFQMCELLANDLKCEVSDLENMPRYEGTYFSLLEFRKIDSNVFFVIGADNLSYLDQWIQADKLISQFNFIVLERIGYDVNQIINSKFNDFKDHFIVLPLNDGISSSLFRTNHNENLLRKNVYEYIIKNKLYNEE